MAVQQHDDFGAKIGGAKKDLWQRRGLLSDDLSEMNEREAEKYVKKDNIWKKNDYQAMIESGIPFDVVYFIKTVRDSINAAPFYLRSDDTPEKRLERQKQYIDTIREVQSAVEGITTKAEALEVFEQFMIDGAGYYEKMTPGVSRAYYATQTEKGRANPFITDEIAKSMFFRSERDFDNKITQKAIKDQFGVSKELKIPRGYDIRFNDGKHSWSANNDWKPETYFVVKGSRILQKNFETRDEALKWVQDYAKGKGENKKIKLVPPQLENIERDGVDYRRGRNTDGQMYLDVFGFKGGEFGNWMSPIDRQASLNFGYDALKDLADALHITDRDVSYGGHLSIAFGARGSGNAMAHYEPLRNVINLTKMRGAGSLAHEWWHGLDDYLGTKLSAGGYLSDNPRVFPLFSELIQTMKYKPQTLEEAEKSTEMMNERYRRNAERWTQSSFMVCPKDADDKTKAEYARLHEAFMRGEEGSVDKISELRKATIGRVIPKSERESLMFYERMLRGMAERTEPVIGRTETDYYRNSKQMGQVCEKENNYWDSNVEMTARAFATYVMDRLPGRSDYLVGHAECAITFIEDKDGNLELLRAYPQGEERRAINEVFDKIVAELKLQNILTHDDRIAPAAAVPVYQNEPVFAAAAVHAGRANDYDAAWGAVPGGTQMTLFDYDSVPDYEDEDEFEI